MFRKLFVLLALVSFAHVQPSMAQDDSAGSESESIISRTGFIPTVGIGANVLTSVSNTNASGGVIGFHGSFAGNYFFTPNVGVSFGADITFRGFSSTTTSSSATFLDIPLAFAFTIPGGVFGKASRAISHLGLFYALPLSDFSGDLTVSQTKQGYLGLLFSHDTLFPLSPSFAMGFSTWLKYGLAAALEGTQVKFLDFGIGLVFAF